MSWYGTSEDFFKEEKEKQQAQMNSGKNARNWRFKLQKNTKGFFVFLQDLEFFCKEHQFHANNSYYNYETCVDEIYGECPLCESDNRPALIAVATIIDLTEYKKKDGTFSKPGVKKPLVLKQGAAEKFLERQQRFGSLVGKKIEINRGSDPKGEATGTDIVEITDANMENLKKLAPKDVDPTEWLTPFDLAEMFKPKTPEELRKILGVPDPIGSEESKGYEEEKEEPSEGSKSLADLV